MQVSVCEKDVEPSVFYVLLLTQVKPDHYTIFITRLQISEEEGLKVSQRMIGKFVPDKRTVDNGFQGL